MAKATGNRKKLDANKDGKISKEDFAMLRKKKGKKTMVGTKKKSKMGKKKPMKMMYGGKSTKKMSKGGASKRR